MGAYLHAFLFQAINYSDLVYYSPLSHLISETEAYDAVDLSVCLSVCVHFCVSLSEDWKSKRILLKFRMNFVTTKQFA